MSSIPQSMGLPTFMANPFRRYIVQNLYMCVIMFAKYHTLEKQTCPIGREMEFGYCKNLSVFLVSTMLAFPLSGDFLRRSAVFAFFPSFWLHCG